MYEQGSSSRTQPFLGPASRSTCSSFFLSSSPLEVASLVLSYVPCFLVRMRLLLILARLFANDFGAEDHVTF